MAVELNFIDRIKQQAFIRFKNNTCYSIEIIWIDFDNKENTYGILAPDKFLDVNTYSTHLWIFRECMSKLQMVVGGKKIFSARAWITEYKRLGFHHPIEIPLRTMIVIQMPALDLQQLCLLKLANDLKTKEDVMTLEIPRILQKELTQMILNKAESNFLMHEDTF